jgi:hypothetical protein
MPRAKATTDRNIGKRLNPQMPTLRTAKKEHAHLTRNN